MKLANLPNDCFPEPPTPTNKALPHGLSVMREMRHTWQPAAADTAGVKGIPTEDISPLRALAKERGTFGVWPGVVDFFRNDF